ncbi:UNKNOWN [Stylonychia lemnae]|uniref:Cyclin-like domain-containing protein n=1 Tax=Stylonychia lemnae TaxID=5949 RepID=A0A078A472_STYLE|nr:UNKNOWN [Stylonychia lemnae]|eukprot:CDW77063.1 UNKNOWN [Stylonychia lemnae]
MISTIALKKTRSQKSLGMTDMQQRVTAKKSSQNAFDYKKMITLPAIIQKSKNCSKNYYTTELTSPSQTQETQDTISKRFSSCSISINLANFQNKRSSIASIDMDAIQSTDTFINISDQIKSCGVQKSLIKKENSSFYNFIEKSPPASISRPLSSLLSERKRHSIEQVAIQAIIGDPRSCQGDKSSSKDQNITSSQKLLSNLKILSSNDKLLTQAYYNIGLSEKYRAKMINWLLQVFRVFNKSNEKTIFLSISLMDRYYQQKLVQNEKINKQDFHLIGLACISISSKLEDLIPIFPREIIQEAAHDKYQKKELASAELDILRSLSFKTYEQSLYEESMTFLKNHLLNNADQLIFFDQHEDAQLNFIQSKRLNNDCCHCGFGIESPRQLKLNEAKSATLQD